MDSLTIRIPLPPKGCAQNTHGHWRKRHRAEQDYRMASMQLAFLARMNAHLSAPAFKRATIAPTFYCGRNPVQPNDGAYRPLDSTNAAASLKAAVDGLVDAGIFPADDHRTVRMMPPVLLRRAKEHQGRAEVVLEVSAWMD